MTTTLGTLQLLPPPEDHCQICATKHVPEDAHNAQSLYYQIRFTQKYGRAPTWKDAIAHCPEAHRAAWERELRALGAWTEPLEDIAKTVPMLTERQQEETPITPILMYGEDHQRGCD